MLLVMLVIPPITPLVSADYDSRIACNNAADCASCGVQPPATCYCKAQTASCWVDTSSSALPLAQTGPTEANNQADNAANLNDTTITALLSQQPAADQLLPDTDSEILGQEQIMALQDNLILLQQQVSQLTGEVQSLSLQGSQVSGIKTDLNTVSSGLASLQQNLDATKSELSGLDQNLKQEQKATKLLSSFLLIIIIVAVAAALIYFLSGRQRKNNLHLVKGITNPPGQERNSSDLLANLERAGRDTEEIRSACQSPVKQDDSNNDNYSINNPLSSGGRPNFNRQQLDTRKIASISIVSVLIIISAIFLLKGITAGQAIRFQTEEELSRNVLQELQAKIADNQFYSLVQSALLCVEVKDGLKSVSFKILKAAAGQSIDPAARPCSEDDSYHAAVKFASWKNFAHLMDDFNCKTARELHSSSSSARGVYVLPSQLVLPGFKKNPQVDYSLFCPLFSPCLTAAELAVLGC